MGTLVGCDLYVEQHEELCSPSHSDCNEPGATDSPCCYTDYPATATKCLWKPTGSGSSTTSPTEATTCPSSGSVCASTVETSTACTPTIAAVCSSAAVAAAASGTKTATSSSQTYSTRSSDTASNT